MMNIRKLFLYSLISSLSISALVAIFIFLFGNFGEIEFKLLITTLSVGGFSLTGLCSSLILAKKNLSYVAYSGILCSITGFLLSTLILWGELSEAFYFKLLLIFIIASFSTAHSSLLLLALKNKKMVDTITVITIIFITLVALMLVYLVLNLDNGIPGEFYFRMLGVFAVLDILGTITTPIIRKLRP